MSPLDAALDYADRGWRVVPLHYLRDDGTCSCGRGSVADGHDSAGKHPRLGAWQDKATDDPDIVERWWSKDERNNVGIATGGAARLVVLDVDAKHDGFASLDRLVAQHGELPPTPTSETGGGGRHYYFVAPPGPLPRNSAGQLGSGLDIRGEGGQVVAPPSVHASGASYRWAIHPSDEDLAELPSWILALLRPAARPARFDPEAEEAPVDEGGRNDFLTRYAGRMRRIGLDAVTILQVLRQQNAAKCSPPLPDDEVERIAGSVARYSPAPLPDSPDDWRRELREVYKKGEPSGEYEPTRRNVRLVLQHSPEYRGRIWYDETRGRVQLGDRPISEDDIGQIADDLDDRWNWPKLQLGTVYEAIRNAAHQNPVDSLRDYLRGLEWDGEDRLAYMLERAVGAEPNELTRAYGRRWGVQAVARGLQPGCKADSVLTLVGDQGLGKSSFFAELAPDGWFGDTPFDIRSDNRFSVVNQVWIYELAELASFQSSRSDAIKAFVSSTHDSWRMPYARTPTTHPRRVVLVATTNEMQFLADPTGSRRFWPVRVFGPLDRQWLRDNRDQIWAEAVHLYQSGEQWHLTAEEDGWRRYVAGQYEEEDPWTSLVAAWAHTHRDFTTHTVLSSAIGMDTDKQNFRGQTRVEAILRRLGYWLTDGIAIVQNTQVKTRIWRAPASVHPIQGDLLDGTPESPERAAVTPPAPYTGGA